MSSAPEPEAAPPAGSQPPEPERPAPQSSSERPKKKKLKSKYPKPAIPKTEDEINSPDKQTMGMLTVLAVLTFFMWAFARGGCNYHPPKETRDPRKVDLVDLARDPKDAALEFEQRWATKSFGGALELAKGPLVEQLKGEQATCDADPKCAQQASDLRSKVQNVSVLLERDPFRAVARVTTYGVAATPQRYIIKLERDQQLWKAVSREVDDGSFKARPSAEQPGTMIRPPLAPPPGMSMSSPDGSPTPSLKVAPAPASSK